MATRTFVAIDLSPDVCDALDQAGRRIGQPPGSKIRWTPARNMHLTLAFLGNVDDDVLADVCRTTRDVAARARPIEMTVRGIVPVPPAGRRLRMFWTGVEETEPRLAPLVDDLQGALEPLGFPPETRAFRPHVTVARVRFTRNAGAVREAALPWQQHEFGKTTARELVVYSSELTPKGPVYAPLARAPLGEPDATQGE
ncbi:MAG: RNA 2',3'-cyclic phosphodiesterase [Phycisphaerae bacterium]